MPTEAEGSMTSLKYLPISISTANIDSIADNISMVTVIINPSSLPNNIFAIPCIFSVSVALFSPIAAAQVGYCSINLASVFSGVAVVPSSGRPLIRKLMTFGTSGADTLPIPIGLKSAYRSES